MRNVVKGAVIALLSVGCAPDQEPWHATSARALVVTAPPARDMVMYARSSVEIGRGSVVRGHLGVFTTTAAPSTEPLSGGVRLDVGPWTDVGASSGTSIYAYSAAFAWASNIHHAYATNVARDMHYQGIVSGNVQLEMPNFPRVRPVTPGTAALVVPSLATYTLSATTARAQVVVESGATLRLQAGEHQVADLSLAEGARLIARGPAVLRVAGRFFAGDDVYVETSTAGTAGGLRIEVLGRNGGLGLAGDLPAAVEIGARGHVRAVFLAPHGTVSLGQATTSTGAIVARDVRLGTQVYLNYEDGVVPTPGSGPPLAFADRLPATEDQTLTIPPEGVLANDLDPHAYVPLTAELIRHARNGTVTLALNGALTYQPNAQFEGQDTFTYRARRTSAFSVTTTVTINVDGMPDVPVIASVPSGAAHVGQMWRYLPRVQDPDMGDVHTFSLEDAPSGATVNASTGLISWMPSAGQIGPQTFELLVVDSTLAEDTQTFTVDVQPTPASERFVLYADESLIMRGKAADGHVGVRNTGAGWLLHASRARLEYGTVGYYVGTGLYADSIDLGEGSVVHDVYTAGMTAHTSAHYGFVAALPPMPAFPVTSTATPGSTPFVVATGTTRALSSTVSVGAVTVEDNACLDLRPGIHHFASLTVGFASCVAVWGPVEIRIAGALILGDYAYVGPALGADIGTNELRIEANAQPWPAGNPWGTPAITTGSHATLSGTVIAPRGTLVLGPTSLNNGSFAAKHIIAGWGSLMVLGERAISNRPPVIVSSPPTNVAENTSYAYAAEVIDPDVNDTQMFSLLTAPSGMTVDADGLVAWASPTVGAHEVIVRVEDSAGAPDTQRFILTVTDTNTPPQIVSEYETQATVGAQYVYDVDADDADGDTLTYSLSVRPTGMAINASTGVVTWTPTIDQVGPQFVTVTVLDGGPVPVQQDFTITVVGGNAPPAFVSSPLAGAVVGRPYASSTHAIDPNAGDVVTYELVEWPDGLTLNAATGALRWTPLPSQAGSHTLIVVARDDESAPSAPQTTHLVVDAENGSPEITSSAPTTVAEGAPYTYSVTATDPDGDAMVFALDNGPAGMACDPSSGAVTWTPSARQVEPASVSLRVTDTAGNVAHQSFTVTVTPVNDPPSITSTPVLRINERSPYRYVVRAVDPDVGDTLSYAVAGPDDMSISGNDIAWLADEIGDHPVTVTVTDSSGESVQQPFTLTVVNVNDAPVFVEPPLVTATQHIAYTYLPEVVDLDEGDVLTFQLDARPLGMAVDPATGELIWTPGPRQVGGFDVLLRVTDTAGEMAIQSFTIVVGDVNDAPAFTSAPVTSARENQRYAYALRASDPDAGDELTFTLQAGPPGLVLDRSTNTLSWVPSARRIGEPNNVAVTVSDGDISVAQTFSIAVAGDTCGPTSSGARCDALGFAHSVRADSVPMGGVTVTELPPQGATRTFTTDGETGLAMLGGAGEGVYRWTFEAARHVPVTRSAELVDAQVQWIGVPRLAPLTDLVATITPSGGHANDPDGRVDLTFGEGVVATPATLRAALLDAQSLPSFAPAGWSPAVGVYYDIDATVNGGPVADFRLPAEIPDGAVVVLARYDAAQDAWISMGVQSPTGPTSVSPGVLDVTLATAGGYAVFVGDSGASAPATGAPLVATAPAGTPSTVEASGRVVPEVQTITVDSLADDYTGQAQVWIAPPAGTPSGVTYPARLFEQYLFQDGRRAEVPSLPFAVTFHRYPRVPTAPEGALSASFPVRPRHLLGTLGLPDVQQRIELRPAVAFEGAALDGGGGAVSSDGVVLTVPSGALSGPALVHLESLDAAAFTLDGTPATRAFELEWSVTSLANGARLGFDTTALASPGDYILARRDISEVQVVWQPVERLSANIQGDLTSLEPSSGGLPGVTRAGTYALFRAPGPAGVVRGVVRDGSAQLLGDVLVRVARQPWGAVTAASGAYVLVGSEGALTVHAERPNSTDTALETTTLADVDTPVTVDLILAPRAPFVVSVRPSAGATNVPVVAAIDVELSEPIAPSSLAAVSLFETNTPANVVPIRRSARPGGRHITLLTERPLAYATAYTLALTGLTDVTAQALAAPTTFGFTTAPAPIRSGQSAQLVSYAPGMEDTPCAPYFGRSFADVTCVTGSAGMAEAGQPVVLVNEDTGETSTVLAGNDGSFRAFVRAGETDLISAIFVNANGTRTTAPLGMQRLPDGRVALYASGGVVDGTNPFGGAPFQLIIEAGAIARRSVIRFEPLDPADTLAAIGGVTPDEGTLIVGATIEYEGDPLREPADVRFPMTEAQLQLPAGVSATDAGFLLTGPQVIDAGGVPVTGYVTLDRMRYEGGALATHSWPMQGLQLDASALRQAVAVLVTHVRPRPITGYAVACLPEDAEDCDRVTVTNNGQTLILGNGQSRPSRPLGGAVITAQHTSSGPVLRQGGLVAMADRAGRYALAVPLPIGQSQRFTALHPDFTRPGTTDVQSAGGTNDPPERADFVLIPSAASASGRGLRVTVTHSPENPQPWTGEGPAEDPYRARVVVQAQGSTGIPVGLALVPQPETAALVTGETVGVGDVAVIPAPPSPPSGLTASRTFYVSSPRAARVVLRASASEGSDTAHATHTLYVGLAAPPPAVDPSADANDISRPRVIDTWPLDGASAVPVRSSMRITFSKPIHPSVLQTVRGITVESYDTAGAQSGWITELPPALSLGEGGTELTMRFASLQPDIAYRVTIGAPITDLQGRSYDGDPATSAAESTTIRFTTAESVGATVLPGNDPNAPPGTRVFLAGATIHASFAYVIDRAFPGITPDSPGAIRVYDVSNPLVPVQVAVLAFRGGYPRNLRVIPSYSYIRPRSPLGLGVPIPPHPPVYCGVGEIAVGEDQCAGLDRVLLAVTGGITRVGDAGETGSGALQGAGPYLAIVDITNPRACQNDIDCSLVIAERGVTVSSGASIGRLEWSAPILSFIEWIGDQTRISLVDLQAFIYAGSLLPSALSTLPPVFQPGVDVDGDGDYVGGGDVLPMPGSLPPFPGIVRTIALADTTQDIRDYAVDGRALLVGAALGEGSRVDAQGNVTTPRPSSYRTVSSGPSFGTSLDGEIIFAGSTVDAVHVMAQSRIPIYVSPNQLPTTTPRDLALLVVSTAQPSTVRLFLADITNPLIPVLVGRTDGIRIPGAQPSAFRQIEADPLDPDTLLLFAADRHFAISISQLGALMPANGGTHPALIGVDATLGGRGDVGLSDANVTVEAVGAQLNVGFHGPRFEVVAFPGEATRFNPTAFRNARDTSIRRALSRARATTDVPVIGLAALRAGGVASSTYHHYVVVRAPGRAGDITLPILVEGLDGAGVPRGDLGRGFAPVRAISATALATQGLAPRPGAAPLAPLIAHRLSGSSTSAYYNYYVSEPFVLVHESVTADEMLTLRGVGASTRHVLHSSAQLRISLDPSVAGPILDPFRSRVRAGRIRVGTALLVNGYDSRRILGPNPAPIAGPLARAPGTAGLVLAHNREMVVSGTDLVQPTPGLSLAFQRTYRGQDRFEGPLGTGWDHIYDERIIPLSADHVLTGDRVLHVDRHGPRDTDAIADDVELHTGDGRILVFRAADPDEGRADGFRDDPLLDAIIGLEDEAAEHLWYLPPPGVFDALVRFGEHGTYLRVTPDGRRFRYDPRGRLVRIEDKFPGNVQELSYTLGGDLRAITDVSVDRRYGLRIGYYRDAGDDIADPALDVVTPQARPRVRGKIARVVAYQGERATGRDVLYHYTADGQLEHVHEVRSDGMPAGGAVDDGAESGVDVTNRIRRTFRWDDNGYLHHVDGYGDRPLFAADVDINGQVSEGLGAQGHVTLTAFGSNVAHTTSSRTDVLTDDGVTTRFDFSLDRLPEATTVTDSSGSERTAQYFDEELRLVELTRPLGNLTRYTYQTSSPLRRSQANLVSVQVAPNSRGGDALTMAMESDPPFDPMYNLPVGTHRDFDEVITTFDLSGDGLYVGRTTRGGLPTVVIRNTRGQITDTIAPDGTTSHTVYQATTGLPIESRDGDRVTTLRYENCANGDGNGILIGQPCEIVPPAGTPTALEYARNGAVVGVSRGSYIRAIAYDRNGRASREVTQDSGAVYRQTDITYSQLGLPLTTTESHLEVDGAPSSATWSNTPDPVGRLGTSRTPLGFQTTYGYARGRPATEITLSGTLTRVYDANGNIISVDDRGTLETFDADGHDRPRVTLDRRGLRTQYTYRGSTLTNVAAHEGTTLLNDYSVVSRDAAGRVASWTQNGGGTWSIDRGSLESTLRSPEQLETRTTWDTAGRTRVSSTNDGRSTRDVEYRHEDINNQVVTTTSEGGDEQATVTRFDGHGHVRAYTDSANTDIASFTRRGDGTLLSRTRGPTSMGMTTTLPATALGESQGRASPSDVRLDVRHDADRRVIAEGRPTNGRRYIYDDLRSRLTSIVEPDQSTWSFGNFNNHDLPQSITTPGSGSMSLTYTAGDQVASQTVVFRGYIDAYTFTYDGLGRMRTGNHTSSAQGASSSTWSREVDVSGNVVETQTLNGSPRTYQRYVRSDGAVQAELYPSSMQIRSDRDGMGRLRLLTDGARSYALVERWSASGSPERVTLGNGVVRDDTFDHRGRLDRRVYSNGSRVMADMRYAYDDGDREVARQAMHAGGRTSRWQYDDDGRLTRAEVLSRPPSATGDAPSGGYIRTIDYDLTGGDAATAIVTTGAAPRFASVRSNVDALGFAGTLVVDGTAHTRTRDELGNVTSTVLRDGPATLAYDGLSRLRRATLGNGTVVDYTYRGDGALLSRAVTCGSQVSDCTSGVRTYVYSGLQLLEEYMQTSAQNAPWLRARYVYEDASDIPLTAETFATPASVGQRVFYVTDRAGSVVGVLDEVGEWVERVDLDPFGAPSFGAADILPPEISSISTSGGELQVVFTEPVAARQTNTSLPAAAAVAPLAAALHVRLASSGAEVAGTWSYVDVAPGTAPRTSVRFVPSSEVAANTEVRVVAEANGVVDDWSNGIAETEVDVTWGGAGYTGSAPGSTLGAASPRSFVGSGLAFQAHLYDAEAGLVLARARVLDPVSGEFLQRDPEGYTDSVNQYAAMANDPVNNRDPTGRVTDGGGAAGFVGALMYDERELELNAKICAAPGMQLDSWCAGLMSGMRAKPVLDAAPRAAGAISQGHWGAASLLLLGAWGVVVSDDDSSDKKKPLEEYEVGPYGELKKKPKKDGADVHLDHQPSHASNVARAERELGRPLTGPELEAIRDLGTAVAVPGPWHEADSRTFGGRNTPEQIERDSQDQAAAAKADSKRMVDAVPNDLPDLKAKARAAARKVRKLAR